MPIVAIFWISMRSPGCLSENCALYDYGIELHRAWSTSMDRAELPDAAKGAYDEFRKEGDEILVTQADASEIIRCIKDALNPLFADWQKCYLVGAGEVDPVLLETGHDTPIPINTLTQLWDRLNRIMIRSASAHQRSHSAYTQILRELQMPPADPPWLTRQRGIYHCREVTLPILE
jgi:hypothetical protein